MFGMENMATTFQVSTGETVLFWILAVAMVAAAVFGLLITKRAVYTVVCVLFVMVCLAFLYTALEAPFMGVTQVMVYTGAILMMFLFVLMLIGIDSADSSVETIKSQRWLVPIAGLGMVIILGGLALTVKDPQVLGLDAANADSNPVGVAKVIFGNHVLTMELTGTLLVVAALGAMTLTHRDRVTKRKTQLDVANDKMQAYWNDGVHPGQGAAPGVYAESNSAANPPLTVGGKPLNEQVSRVLRVRGQARSFEEISPATVEKIASGVALSGPEAFGTTVQAQMPGMSGEEAPVWDDAPATLEAGAPAPELEAADMLDAPEKEDK